MLKIKNLRGECQHCGKPIEFHAEHAGTTAECPHCSQPTELFLVTPAEESSPVRRKAIIFTVVAILILAGGLIGAVMALKRAERLKAGQMEKATPVPPPLAAKPLNPFAAQEFQVSLVTLDQGAGRGSSLRYATGTIVNLTKRQRFGVKVELELFDEVGNKLGGAIDYQKVLEPNAEWKFRALITDKRTSFVKVTAITESQ
ncbi:MAG: FxLYD domain-containing protein [Verrucomicrobiota bacterium]